MMSLIVVLIAETTSKLVSALQKHYRIHTVRSGKQGILKVKETSADVNILDAISLKTSGLRICKQMRRHFPDKAIIHLHRANDAVTDSPADARLVAPVMPRAVMTSITLLTMQRTSHLIRCGQFVLDIDRRVMIAHGTETVLTPKEADLIAAFLQNPNQTLERKWLMQQIWQTDYTGDTRTLNVHIRSIREALEVDASNPQYIKTVRGIGYRFEIALNENTDQ